MQHSNSEKIFHDSLQLMPGGVNSPARAFGAVGGNPVVIRRAEGAYLYDVDDNCYIDFVGSWGPMILGHRHPAVTQAVVDAAQRGTSFGAPTEGELEMAQLIVDLVPSVEKVRLVNSGTEATMSAIRLARGYTKRHRVVKFAGNYHGHVDSLLVAAGSSAATLSVPDSPGVTPGTSQDTLVLPYNDVDSLTETFSRQGDEIAGLIMEPVVGNMGCVPATQEFLQAARELTWKHDALLIFDEVMSGFRVAPGGAQSLFHVTPDLTTLGKIVGGGLPIGAYGGRADIMDHMLPAGQVFQAGTLSGNPIATAAGIATLQQLQTHPPYDHLETLGAQLEEGLLNVCRSAGIPASVGRVGSMLTLFFTPDEVTGWDAARRCDTARFGHFFRGLLERGVYLPCSQYEALFISAAHQPKDIEATIQAAEQVLSTP